MSSAFKEMFFVVIQLGAIMAVVVLYFKKLFPVTFEQGMKIEKKTMVLWAKIVVASIPAAVIGLKFNDVLEEMFYNYQTVAIALIFYGIIYIWIENKHKGQKAKIMTLDTLDFKTAFIIGCFQVLALIPGTSRSGATILGAIIFGTSRTVAAEFTFFLAIPVMFGASLIKLMKFGLEFSSSELMILIVGMVTAFVISIIAIKFLVGYIKKHDFKIFGWYRIVLGLIVIVYFALV
jgi:undecaprenyl-diphosphatase